MKFNKIDMDKWERKEHFQNYNYKNKCSYSITSNIDITKLIFNIKKRNLKFYPTFIYIVSRAVNSMKEFKMGLDESENIGFYDEVSPSYTIFHDDDKTFSCIFTEYNSDFETFYQNVSNDMKKYKNVKGFELVKPEPNAFPISCVPWLNYTGFNLNVPIDINFYAPIITWGKYTNNNGNFEMPLTVQINHAVADGYHTSMLFKKIQDDCSNLPDNG